MVQAGLDALLHPSCHDRNGTQALRQVHDALTSKKHGDSSLHSSIASSYLVAWWVDTCPRDVSKAQTELLLVDGTTAILVVVMSGLLCKNS